MRGVKKGIKETHEYKDIGAAALDERALALAPDREKLENGIKELLKHKRKGELYPERLVLMCRVLYETCGVSLYKISQNTGVDHRTLQAWRASKKWTGIDQRDLHKLEQITKKAIAEKLAKLGMPAERALELLIDGIQNPKHIHFNHKGEVVRETIDYNTRNKYLKDYFTLVGAMGAGTGKQLEINTSGEGSVNIQVNLPQKKAPK